MAVQLDGKATEKQRKYLGYLSGKGKERYGKDFSVRKIAESKGINWEEMSVEEANQLIKEVKEMVETQDFVVTEREFIEEVTKAAQEERKVQKEEKPGHGQAQAQASPENHIYMIQLVADESKLPAITVVLEAMNVGYVILQEVRA